MGLETREQLCARYLLRLDHACYQGAKWGQVALEVPMTTPAALRTYEQAIRLAARMDGICEEILGILTLLGYPMDWKLRARMDRWRQAGIAGTPAPPHPPEIAVWGGEIHSP